MPTICYYPPPQLWERVLAVAAREEGHLAGVIRRAIVARLEPMERAEEAGERLPVPAGLPPRRVPVHRGSKRYNLALSLGLFRRLARQARRHNESHGLYISTALTEMLASLPAAPETR